ncbi:MAG: glycine-rich protein, partial [Vicingaceae bacterium]|nr:glycine-rich protein [Vicingaceae bacterium]
MKKSLLKIAFGSVALAFGFSSFAQTTFNYTGSVQTYVVPSTGTYSLESWGAEGGTSFSKSQNGYVIAGKGGYTSRDMNLTAGTTLYIYVGGQGDSHAPTTTGLVAGGYNGGGASDNTTTYGGGGGGGGASHIATATGLLSTLAGNQSAVLVVAGGGGGAWACNFYDWTNYRDASDGGDGGGLVAQGGGYGYTMGYTRANANNNILNQADTRNQAFNYCTGGSQSAGGIQGFAQNANPFYATAVPSAFGLGATSGRVYSHSGGGGGGGWYGGGAGASGENANGTGGGGGSSYHANDPSGVMTSGVRTGDGQVVITLLCNPLNLTVTPDDTV